MKKTFRIKGTNQPLKFKITSVCFWLFMLHYWQAPGYLVGAVCMLLLLWIGIVILGYKQSEEVDIFDGEAFLKAVKQKKDDKENGV